MRQWLVNPNVLCRKHLLGEHVECHMFLGTIKKGSSLSGYISGGLVEVDKIVKRHRELADEMEARGYKHQSPMSNEDEKYLWKEVLILKRIIVN